MVVARADIVGAEGRIRDAKSAYQQTVDELDTKQEIYRRNPGAVAVRDIEKLQVAVQGRHRARSTPPRPPRRRRRPA
jgi:hypothetical protein